MKIISVIFAQMLSEYAFEPEFAGESAFQRAVKNLANISGAEKILVLAQEGCNTVLPEIKIPVEVVSLPPLTVGKFFETVMTKTEGFDRIAFGYGDTPFISEEITAKLIANMEKYGGDYTFADGFPKGLVPEFLSPAAVGILVGMEKNNGKRIGRDTVFETIKPNINMFDVETVVSPHDYRHLRINLACDTKGNFLLCSRLKNKNILEELKSEKTEYLKTLPVFYNFQIASRCGGKCNFCPYPAAFLKKYGTAVDDSKIFMSKENFRDILNKIQDFSDDAVIGFSLWGEASYHPDFVNLAEMVLSHTKFSLVIETCGENFPVEMIENLKAVVEKAAPRENSLEKIYFILSIDGETEGTYEKLHGRKGLHEVCQLYSDLNGAFPNAVYPQFLRTKDNEAELQNFFLSWTKVAGNVIIQKYDDFCGLLENKKVVDLRPIERTPCWHLRRDISVLVDGTVPLCRERLFDDICGNIITDDLSAIWQKMSDELEKHRCGEFSEKCERCDEFYTFNF